MFSLSIELHATPDSTVYPGQKIDDGIWRKKLERNAVNRKLLNFILFDKIKSEVSKIINLCGFYKKIF